MNKIRINLHSRAHGPEPNDCGAENESISFFFYLCVFFEAHYTQTSSLQIHISWCENIRLQRVLCNHQHVPCALCTHYYKINIRAIINSQLYHPIISVPCEGNKKINKNNNKNNNNNLK